ncbi:MAG: hypothetical protein GXP53_00180 [Deltaproteobacteria bacterium]|nr:hypothetical protein [Deltaproteobacteria bacterium]
MNFNRRILKNIGVVLAFSAALMVISVSYAHAGRSFFIERPKLGLNTYYEFEEEKRQTPDTDTETVYHDMRESATIATKGWIYHPNLLAYHFFFMPGWRQEKFKDRQKISGTSQASSQDTTLLAYDVGATLLRNKPVTLDIFTKQSNWRIQSKQVQSTDMESATRGARLNFVNKTLPVSFGFVNSKSIQAGFYRYDENRDELRFNIRHNAKNSITELNILNYETSRTTAGIATTPATFTIDSNTTNTELRNTLFINGDESVRLDSQVYDIREGHDDINSDSFLISENLFWTHDKNLDTRYGLKYSRRKFDGAVNMEKFIKAGLTHRLYNRLTTDLGADIAYNDFAGASEDRYRSNLGFNYRRAIPWGTIELGAAYNFGLTRRSGSANIIPTKERHVLTSATTTFLEQANAHVESIVVTDLTGAIVYIEDIDYRVRIIGSEAMISRIPLGAIVDGQEVIIQYTYLVDSDYDDSRFGQNYRVDMTLWSFFYFTYTHRRLEQSILSATPAFLSEDMSGIRIDDTFDSIQIRLDTGWSDTRFLYSNEDRRSGNSMITRSVREIISLRPFTHFSFNFSGHYGNRRFKELNAEEIFYNFGSSIGWKPKWWCDFNMVCTRNGISGDMQDTVFTEISPTLRLQYGIWSCRLSYELSDQRDKAYGSRRWAQRAYFVINRRLW